MSKLQLPSVTLLICDGVSATRAAKVLEICKSKADFGAVKLCTHLPIDNPHRVEIMPLTSHIAYSIWCLTEMYKHIDTSHCLVVQRDGWILNPQSWNNDWLNYDYIGPLFVQHDDVGSGGFSLRSRRIMEAASKRYRPWTGTDEDAHTLQRHVQSYEDGVVALRMRSGSWHYAPKEEAGKFAAGGNPNPVYHNPYPFGFHGTYHNVDHETGYVYPLCVHNGKDCECRNEHINVLMELEK